MRREVMLTAALLAGCDSSSSTPRPSFDPLPPDHYVVVVDPATSAEHVELLGDAMAVWSGVLDRPDFFTVRISSFDRQELPPPHEIRVLPLPGQSILTGMGGQTATWKKDEHGRPHQARIWLDTDIDAGLLFLVMQQIGRAHV